MASLGCRLHARWGFIRPAAGCCEDPANSASTTGLGTGRYCPEGGLLPVFARYSDFTITIDYMGRGAVHLLQTDARVCNACYFWGGRHPNFHPLQVLTLQFLSSAT